MNAEVQPPEAAQATEQLRPVGPGARLREAREARGLTPVQAAEQLKLKAEIIAALEGDDFERLPSILFARGYLRSYARLLDLPPEEVISTFDRLGLVEEQPAVPKGAILTHKRRGEHLLLRWGSVVVLAVLGALLAAWFHGESTSSLLARLGLDGTAVEGARTPEQAALPTVPAPAQPVAEAPAAPLALPAAQAPGPAAAELAGPPMQAEVPAPAVAPPPASAQTEPPAAPARPSPAFPSDAASAAAAPTAGAVPGDAAAEPPAGAAGSDRLVLEVAEDSWAEVTDGEGERLVYQLLKAGSIHEVSGAAPFTIFLGNAPGVELSYNGQPVTNIRANSRGVARLTLGAP